MTFASNDEPTSVSDFYENSLPSKGWSRQNDSWCKPCWYHGPVVHGAYTQANFCMMVTTKQAMNNEGTEAIIGVFRGGCPIAFRHWNE
jgi:hypothetical protein